MFLNEFKSDDTFEVHRLVWERPSSTPRSAAEAAETQESFDPDKLSVLGHATYLDFMGDPGDPESNTIEGIKADLTQDLYNSDLGGSAMMTRELTVGNTPAISVKKDTEEHMVRLLDGIVDRFESKLWELDQEYQRKLEGAQDQAEVQAEYQAKLREVLGNSRDLIVQLNSDMRELTEALGGDDEAISTLEELGVFRDNGLKMLEQLEIDQAAVDRALEEGLSSTDPEYLEEMYDEDFRLIRKIQSTRPEDKLTQSDYDSVINTIEPYFGTNIDTESTGVARTELRDMEYAGHFTMVYAMNPTQRFQLGERIVNRYKSEDPDRGNQAIRFLTGIKVLDIGQAEELLGKLGDQYALNETDREHIRLQRTQIETLRSAAKKALGTKMPVKFFDKYGFTEGLVAIGGGVAGIMIFLPILLNIKDPTSWPHYLFNPATVAAAGIGTLAAEHLSSEGRGMGHGAVTRTIIGQPGETREASEAMRSRLAELMGENPQVYNYLTADNGKMLRDIDKLAQNSPDEMEYRFKFEDLTELHVEEKVKELMSNDPNLQEEDAIEQARIDLAEKTDEYSRKELDGRTHERTEQKIAEFYHYLRGRMGFTNVDAMMAEFEVIDGQRYAS